jgi:hypothetical protein
MNKVCKKRTMLMGTEELIGAGGGGVFLAIHEAIHVNEDDRALFKFFHLPEIPHPRFSSTDFPS